MGDLRIIENGDGGDAVLNGNDLEIINGFQNMPYLGMFGGNIKASTVGEKVENEQAFDWWGNNLLMKNNPTIQFNSLLEKKLKDISLTPSGRIEILNTVKQDLEFMNEFSTVTVETSIISTDRIEILIKLQEPDNLESNEFTYIWDSTNSELTMIQ